MPEPLKSFTKKWLRQITRQFCQERTILDELVLPGHVYNDVNKVGDELDLGHYFIVFWCHQSLLWEVRRRHQDHGHHWHPTSSTSSHAGSQWGRRVLLTQRTLTGQARERIYKRKCNNVRLTKLIKYVVDFSDIALMLAICRSTWPDDWGHLHRNI